MRKWLYTAAATAAVATFGGFESEADASTHKVSSGDSLWKIANKYNVSVDHIKKLNNLSSELIRPNQVLKVSGDASLAAASTPSASGETAVSASAYVVQPGDTLSAIARKTATSVSELKSLNNLSSDLIFSGQSLKVKGSAAQPTPSTPVSQTPSESTSGSYTVKPGDSLSRIAVNHGISLAKLMELNSLNGHMIFPGQKLSVSGQVSVAQPSQPAQPIHNADGSYTVKAGDTLSKIAVVNKMSLAELKRVNNISSDLIRVGQKLQLNGSAQSTTPSAPAQTVGGGSSVVANVSVLIQEAQSHLGTPYVWGGSVPGGFDCSGFIYYVYNKAGFSTARTNAEGQHARSYEVSNPQVGDLVFFENTYKRGISHVGIYLGGNQFIHAGDNGVQISSLNNSYWNSKFESFKRFYN